MKVISDFLGQRKNLIRQDDLSLSLMLCGGFVNLLWLRLANIVK